MNLHYFKKYTEWQLDLTGWAPRRTDVSRPCLICTLSLEGKENIRDLEKITGQNIISLIAQFNEARKEAQALAENKVALQADQKNIYHIIPPNAFAIPAPAEYMDGLRQHSEKLVVIESDKNLDDWNEEWDKTDNGGNKAKGAFMFPTNETSLLGLQENDSAASEAAISELRKSLDPQAHTKRFWTHYRSVNWMYYLEIVGPLTASLTARLDFDHLSISEEKFSEIAQFEQKFSQSGIQNQIAQIHWGQLNVRPEFGFSEISKEE